MSNTHQSIEQAADAIIALINSRATSPRKHEIEAIIATVTTAAPVAALVDVGRTPLHAEIDRVADEYSIAFADDDPRAEPLGEQLEALAAQLPQRKRRTQGPMCPTIADVAAWAEVAFTYAYEERDHEEDAIFNADYPALNSALANLVTAARVLPDAVRLPPLSPQHLAYRALRAEVDAYNHKASKGEEPKDDTPFMALLERVSDAEKAIWATPATTLADVLLRAEIGENNENGAMDDLDNPDAYHDDRAFAQLIRAVLDVVGGRDAL